MAFKRSGVRLPLSPPGLYPPSKSALYVDFEGFFFYSLSVVLLKFVAKFVSRALIFAASNESEILV